MFQVKLYRASCYEATIKYFWLDELVKRLNNINK